jgi:hypothetical protein
MPLFMPVAWDWPMYLRLCLLDGFEPERPIPLGHLHALSAEFPNRAAAKLALADLEAAPCAPPAPGATVGLAAEPEER